MIIIGLTGKIATGKSTVAGIFRELGAEVLDADEIARAVVDRGKPAWTKIVECFGDCVLDKNGFIDRKELGKIVFNSKQKLNDLMGITHPEILKELKKRIEYLRAGQTRCVVVEATLIDKGGDIRGMTDKLVVVTSSRKNQVSRLLKRNNHTAEECLQRINSQSSIKSGKIDADYIIRNDSDIRNLNRQVLEIWNELFRT